MSAGTQIDWSKYESPSAAPAQIDFSKYESSQSAPPTGANTTRSDNSNVPLVTPLPGESFADTMKRAVNMGKQVTPQQMTESEKGAGKKVATVLAAAPLAGPAILTAGAVAPEAASAAAGGGIPGAVAGGATGGALTTALTQPLTGQNPVSKEGMIDIGKNALIGGATGGLLEAGGKLVSAVSSKAPNWWDAVTGYSKALEEAKNANLSRYMLAEQKGAQAIDEAKNANVSRYLLSEQNAAQPIAEAKNANLSRYQLSEQKAQQEIDAAKNVNLSRYQLSEQKGAQAVAEGQANVSAVKAAQPQGQIGNWSDLNQSIGATPAKSLRIGRGASDIENAYGLPGRGLEAEGFTKEILQKMPPTEQAAAIGPRFQAAGKAVQGIADKATDQGVTLDAGQSTFKVITDRIKDPSLQEKAIEIINSHQRELGITNMRQATPTQALALRQALKNDASFGPTATTDSLKGVGRALYSAVSNDLHNAVPGMKEVDMHYGDLAQTMDVVRGQVGKYMAGKWTPPLTAVQKAEQAVPALPNVSPYTPLPQMPNVSPYTPLPQAPNVSPYRPPPQMPNVSPYTPLPSRNAFNLDALKKIGAGMGIAGGGGYGLSRLLALMNNAPSAK